MSGTFRGGRGVWALMVPGLTSGSFRNPLATREERVRTERVRYLAARMKRTDATSPETVFSHASKEPWTFCTAYVNNHLSGKQYACKHVLVQFWKEMLSHRIDGIGVDCNRAADGTVDAALRDAVNEITDSKGSLQSVHWEKFQSCGDCMVYFQISYNNVSRSGEASRRPRP